MRGMSGGWLAAAMVALVAALGVRPASAQCNAWAAGIGYPGLPGGAAGVVTWPTSQGEQILAYGAFDRPAGLWKDGVLRWDGREWTSMGLGLIGRVADLVVTEDGPVAVGDFTEQSGLTEVVRWNGSAWVKPGLRTFSSARAAAVVAGDLYIADFVGVWRHDDALDWQPVGAGMTGVHVLAAYAGRLVAAGSPFTAPISEWDGSAWRPLGSGMNDAVGALVEFEGDLIAGGDFTRADGNPARLVARWNGTGWGPIGPGIPDGIFVADLLVHEGELIAGGSFEFGSPVVSNVARWDGAAWRAMDAGLTFSNDIVYGLASYDGDVVAVGEFLASGPYDLRYAARWDGAGWRGLGPALAPVSSLFAFSGGLLAPSAVGEFLRLPTNSLARWDGATWSAYAPGFGLAGVFAEKDGALLAAGNGFFPPTGLGQYVAEWTGSAWSPLGGPANQPIAAIEAFGPDVVAGGLFTSIGGVGAARVARWDGAAWRAMGPGMNGTVYALRAFGGLMFAGGSFTMAGGTPVGNIAAWDGAQWIALGPGLNGPVSSMVVHEGGLIVAGDFTLAGPVTVNRIARWDGAAWSALGSGMDAAVIDLASFQGELAAVGRFTTAGGVPAARAALWNGAGWRALEEGLDGEVWAVAALGNELMVSGPFARAGDGPSYGVARWVACPACPADLDGDGVVDFSDYLVFLNFYDVGDLGADLDGDGVVDFTDYLAFLTAYDGGC